MQEDADREETRAVARIASYRCVLLAVGFKKQAESRLQRERVGHTLPARLLRLLFSEADLRRVREGILQRRAGGQRRAQECKAPKA
eukprot:5044882-Pleurochrysis_carterae.AAC.2